MRASRSPLFSTSVLLLSTSVLALAQDAPPAADAPARDVRSWTTFKGDPQRSGSSTANIKLPLSLQWRFSSDAPARSYQV